MTKVLDWTARIIAWTAVTICGGVLTVGLSYEIWQKISADWHMTFGITSIIAVWGLCMWAIQRTFDIW